MRQYAYHELHRTILSCPQIEHCSNKVDGVSMKVGGKQHILTNDGYIIPINIVNGLPYIEMVPHTDKEWKELPHIILTSGAPWDPRVVDHHLTSADDWTEILKDMSKGDFKYPFDEHGNYKKRVPVREVPKEIPDPGQEEEEEDTGPQDNDSPPTGEREMNFHEVQSDMKKELMMMSHINEYIQVQDYNKYISCNADTALSLEPESGREAPRIAEDGEFKPAGLRIPPLGWYMSFLGSNREEEDPSTGPSPTPNISIYVVFIILVSLYLQPNIAIRRFPASTYNCSGNTIEQAFA